MKVIFERQRPEFASPETSTGVASHYTGTCINKGQEFVSIKHKTVEEVNWGMGGGEQ